MLMYLHGEDEYRSEEALRGYVAAFQKKHDPAGLSVAKLDGERITAEALQRALATQGLLTSRRMIVIRDLARNKKAEPADVLLALLSEKRLPSENVLVLWERGNPEAGKRIHALYKYLATLPEREPKAVGKDFQLRLDPLIGRAVEKWADDEAQGRGIRLTPSSRALLVSLTGGDLRQITTELEKLCHYRPQGTITDEDVSLFVHAELEPNIFDLTDTIGERDTSRALELLQRQFNAGAAPLYLVTMLTRHFRILRSIQAAGSAHPSVLSRKLRLHPFVVQKALRQVRAFTTADLVRLFDDVVTLDERLKTSSGDPEAELTLFVARACRGSRQ